MTQRVLALSQAKTAVMFLYTTLQSRATALRALPRGDSVSFDTEKGPKGPKATNVAKL